MGQIALAVDGQVAADGGGRRRARLGVHQVRRMVVQVGREFAVGTAGFQDHIAGLDVEFQDAVQALEVQGDAAA